MTREEVAGQVGEDALFADGLDDAIIGYVQRGAMKVALYDAEKCIEILITQEGMGEEEAREYFDYNVLGSWVGDMTPAFAFIGD
ncbi:hypothetical protein [Peribacillus asahii]|uniref:hypothetical protein n=1 Tax=Peribacillus asahii TaxID=228899 RepID=UPI00380DF795